MSPRLHTEFVEVHVHTAKCDSCDKHNKLTLYRCTECGQHVCSLCWNKKSGDRTHVFGGGYRDELEVYANHVVEDDKLAGGKANETKRKTSTRRRVHVISDDEDDDDVLVLHPAPTMGNTPVNDANKQHKKKNAIMNTDHCEDHEDDLPGVWPMVPARRLPVLRPAVPAANTSAMESGNQVTQRKPHTHREESDPESQSVVPVYDNLGRQTMSSQYAFVGDHETNTQGRPPSQSSIQRQQAIRSAYLNTQPVEYRPRPGANVDLQAMYNQRAFANNESTISQARRQTQSAICRPRPGADLDQQATRNELAFADRQHFGHQTPQPSQASVLHQHAAHPAARPAPTAMSQQYAQTPANMEQMASRNQQDFRLMQQAQAYANAKLMQIRNRQELSSHQSARPAANKDQVAAHNQQAFNPNQRSSAAAYYAKQIAAARDKEEASLSRQQANRPTPGPAQASVSHGGASNSSPFPSQAFLSQQHAALLASRQAQHRIATQQRLDGTSGVVQVREPSPEVLQAADVLLFYAGVEQVPELRFRSGQDTHGVSQLLSAADQLDKAGSASSKSRSPSKTLVDKAGAAAMLSISPRDSALNPSPRGTDADSAKARVDKHRARPAGLQLSASTRNTVSGPPAGRPGHSSYRHAATQTDSEPALASSSAAQSPGPNFRRAQSYPGPRLPVSDHAAIYINQWNSGRAALSSRSSSTAAILPAAQPDRPRSPVPALDPHSTTSHSSTSVQDLVPSGGTEEEEVGEASTNAPSARVAMSGEPNDIDVAMGSPDVEILEDDESRRREVSAPENNISEVGKDRSVEQGRTETSESISGLHTEGRAEKHQRGEEKGGRKNSKEQKGSGDVDVIDARKRNGEEKGFEQADDDASDIEITSWNKLDSNKTTDKPRGTNAGARGLGSGRNIKKGVAHVKKPEPKGRKGNTTPKHTG